MGRFCIAARRRRCRYAAERKRGANNYSDNRRKYFFNVIHHSSSFQINISRRFELPINAVAFSDIVFYHSLSYYQLLIQIIFYLIICFLKNLLIFYLLYHKKSFYILSKICFLLYIFLLQNSDNKKYRERLSIPCMNTTILKCIVYSSMFEVMKSTPHAASSSARDLSSTVQQLTFIPLS